MSYAGDVDPRLNELFSTDPELMTYINGMYQRKIPQGVILPAGVFALASEIPTPMFRNPGNPLGEAFRDLRYLVSIFAEGYDDTKVELADKRVEQLMSSLTVPGYHIMHIIRAESTSQDVSDDPQRPVVGNGSYYWMRLHPLGQ